MSDEFREPTTSHTPGSVLLSENQRLLREIERLRGLLAGFKRVHQMKVNDRFDQGVQLRRYNELADALERESLEQVDATHAQD